MPDLEHSLHGHDLGHLRIVAELWGLTLPAPDVRKALADLPKQILDSNLVNEIVSALPAKAIVALNALVSKGGRLPWVQFRRQFGEVRQMGPGRRDRQRPDQNPASTAEVLWYRALVGRAFFDTPLGSEEFAYIPEDLLALIPGQPSTQQAEPLGRGAAAAERAHPLLVNDEILDHVCTLLAAQRMGHTDISFLNHTQPFLISLLTSAQILDADGQPEIKAARVHLEAERGAALLQLAQTWLNSPDHNDLHLIPGLQAEGDWTNDSLAARHFLLTLLDTLPANTWWNLSAFIADIRRAHPDFQRPAGDYDSWYLRDVESGQFLRGFEHWDQIDGALIRYLITGPLHWLGLVDLATPDEEMPPEKATAFRLSGWAPALLSATTPEGISDETLRVHVRSDGRVGVPPLVPRSIRYQIARFCHWEDDTPHEYRYRLTPDALMNASHQGLRTTHLITLLNKYTDAVPPNILSALQRWDQYGAEIQVGAVVVLRVGSPQILQSLRASRAERFLGEPLSPTAIMIKPGAEQNVLAALLELGYLGSFDRSER
jgi:hypothetical protein